MTEKFHYISCLCSILYMFYIIIYNIYNTFLIHFCYWSPVLVPKLSFYEEYYNKHWLWVSLVSWLGVLWAKPRKSIVGSYYRSVFVFLRNHHTDFRSSWPSLRHILVIVLLLWRDNMTKATCKIKLLTVDLRKVSEGESMIIPAVSMTAGR